MICFECKWSAFKKKQNKVKLRVYPKINEMWKEMQIKFKWYKQKQVVVKKYFDA